MLVLHHHNGSQPGEMDGLMAMAGERNRLEEILYLFKAWGVGLLSLFALFAVGTFAYGIYWWWTSPEFREAMMSNHSGKAPSFEAVRAQAAQRKHKIETATATQLRQMIIAEAPNLVQASNRIPVGSKDELEELQPLASVIPTKKSD